MVEAQIAEGIPAEWLEKQGRAVHGTIGQPVQKNKRMPDWTQEEDAYILQLCAAGSSLEGDRPDIGTVGEFDQGVGYRIQAGSAAHAVGFIWE